MDLGSLLTSWTIRLALACYITVVIRELWVGRRRAAGAERKAGAERAARLIWTTGCGLFLVHLASAFHFHHDWSHEAAFAHTAAETERLLGVAFGWGIYFNHLFTLVWMGDVAWWWTDAGRYRRRSRRWYWAVHGFMWFIAFNGAIVFESGPTRWLGIPFTLLMAGLLLQQRRPL